MSGFFKPDLLTPEAFAAMPDYLQAEACRLFREAGFGRINVADRLGPTAGLVWAMMDAPHCHRMPGDRDTQGWAPGADNSEQRMMTRIGGAMLAFMHAQPDGQMGLSMAEAAARTGLNAKSIISAMQRLLTDGYVERLRLATPHRPALWRLTGAGRAGLDVHAAFKAAEKTAADQSAETQP